MVWVTTCADTRAATIKPKMKESRIGVIFISIPVFIQFDEPFVAEWILPIPAIVN
jgi:hypothetical protein